MFFSLLAVDCGQPGSPVNGRVETPDGTTLGAKAWYYCSDGYVLIGSEFRTCQGNGEWNPEIPECRGELRSPILCVTIGTCQ